MANEQSGRRRPRKRPPRDAEHAREALLDAALRRFSAHGYVGTRLADVASDAGYSEGLVYFHFKNKAGLFREVVGRIDADSAWLAPATDRDALVQQLHDGELRYHRDARWRALDHVWAEALAGQRDLLQMIRPQLRNAVGELEGLLSSLEGSADDDDTRHQQALLLLAVSYGARVLRRYDPDFVSPEQAADLMALAARAVLVRATGSSSRP